MSKINKTSDGLKNIGSPRTYMLTDIDKIQPYANNAKKHYLALNYKR